MHELVLAVQGMCAMKTRGGRCITYGTDSLYVYDVTNWTNDMTYQMQLCFPTCEINIKQDTGSLSGFVVVIHNNSLEPVTCSITFFLLICLITAFCVQYMWTLESTLNLK